MNNHPKQKQPGIAELNADLQRVAQRLQAAYPSAKEWAACFDALGRAGGSAEEAMKNLQKASQLIRGVKLTTNYEIRVIALSVAPRTEPTFSEMATEVRITDEAGGEFVEVSQNGRSDLGKIAINPEEWPQLKAAIDRLILECREAT